MPAKEQVPGVLRHDDVDDKSLRRQAAVDQPRQCRCLDHSGRLISVGLLARATGVFGPGTIRPMRSPGAIAEAGELSFIWVPMRRSGHALIRSKARLRGGKKCCKKHPRHRRCLDHWHRCVEGLHPLRSELGRPCFCLTEGCGSHCCEVFGSHFRSSLVDPTMRECSQAFTISGG